MTRPRSIQIGGETFLLVAARDVIELHDRADARQLLERLVRDRHDITLLRRLVEEMDFEVALTDGDVLARAESLLSSGRLVGVRVREPARALDQPTIRPLLDPDDRDDPDDPDDRDGPGFPDRPRPRRDPVAPPSDDVVEILFTYAVRLVDELGEPLAGVALTMDVGGARYACTTDADGVASIQAPEADAARVEVSDLPALREILRPRWQQVRPGAWLQERVDHTYVECVDPMKPVAVKPEIRETIVVQPWVVRARLLELLFDTNKTFLLPGALAHVREIVRLYQRRASSRLLIVGHTDATGDPDDNDLLSRARADSVRAFLCDDADAWLAWYGPDRSPASRWAEGEDLLMLQAVLARAEDASDDTPVRRFQERHGLEPTGTIDATTRRKLIVEYMAADGTSLPAGIEPIIHGCGESFPLPKGEQAASTSEEGRDRRVELFFFDGDLGVLPAPAAETSGPGTPEYPEWCRRAIETHDFFVRAGTVTVRVLLGALQADGDHPADRPERLRLRSRDGLYDVVRAYNDATRVSLRHFAIDFPQVPVAVPCTLRADYHGENRFTHVLFEDVDVGVETECGEGGLCRDDPPPVAPPGPSDPAPSDPVDDDDDVAEFPIL